MTAAPSDIPVLSRYQVVAIFFVDAFSPQDAQSLVEHIAIHVEEDDGLAVFSERAIITGLDVDAVTYDGLSAAYRVDEFIAIAAAF
jgi:hypothetical protein